MFQGKKSKWKPFNEWLENLGLGENVQRKSNVSLGPQERQLEAARIRSKFSSVADKILKQRAQRQV